MMWRWFHVGRYRFCWRLEVGPLDLVWWRRGRP